MASHLFGAQTETVEQCTGAGCAWTPLGYLEEKVRAEIPEKPGIIYKNTFI